MERRSEIRYDANCACIVEVFFLDKPNFVATTGKIINISTSGCLFLSDNLPWQDNDINKIESRIFNILHKKCRLYMPWINKLFPSMIRNVGAFTISVEFDRIQTDDFVRSVAELEPNDVRSFIPKSPWKYNRILPID